MIIEIRNKPKKSRNTLIIKASLIICNAYNTAISFLDAFENIRRNRSAVGVSTDEEQDLLRAMLIFSTSGLDSMLKQLIKDALPEVIKKDAGSLEKFKDFIKKRIIIKENEVNSELLASVLIKENPREMLILELVQDLIGGSLQSAEELFRAASFFNIATDKLTNNIPEIKNIFSARNQIIHEMDVDFNQTNRNRRQRSREEMTNYTEKIFELSNKILEEVKNKL